MSVEEYARIQEFPDNWTICGPIKEQYRQIGNAVPIKLGEAIAKMIIADMHNEKLNQISGFPYSRYKNTSEITWQIEMNRKLEAARQKQAELNSQECEQMKFD